MGGARAPPTSTEGAPALKRTSEDLDALVPALRARDQAAFRALYDQLADKLGGFAFGMLRDRSAAEDAVQQAFLELVKAAPSLRGDGRSVRSWLYRSVRFTCLDEIRRRARHPETLVEELPEISESNDPLDAMFDPDLENALASLTPEQRDVMILRHVGGLSGAEIARAMGRNRAAVYALGTRAEASLRRMLTTVESDSPPASETVKRNPAFGRAGE